MCIICTERKSGFRPDKTTAWAIAGELDKLEHYYIEMVTGRLEPCGSKAVEIARLARHVIRHLVEEWI